MIDVRIHHVFSFSREAEMFLTRLLLTDPTQADRLSNLEKEFHTMDQALTEKLDNLAREVGETRDVIVALRDRDSAKDAKIAELSTQVGDLTEKLKSDEIDKQEVLNRLGGFAIDLDTLQKESQENPVPPAPVEQPDTTTGGIAEGGDSGASTGEPDAGQGEDAPVADQPAVDPNAAV